MEYVSVITPSVPTRLTQKEGSSHKFYIGKDSRIKYTKKIKLKDRIPVGNGTENRGCTPCSINLFSFVRVPSKVGGLN